MSRTLWPPSDILEWWSISRLPANSRMWNEQWAVDRHEKTHNYPITWTLVGRSFVPRKQLTSCTSQFSPGEGRGAKDQLRFPWDNRWNLAVIATQVLIGGHICYRGFHVGNVAVKAIPFPCPRCSWPRIEVIDNLINRGFLGMLPVKLVHRF